MVKKIDPTLPVFPIDIPTMHLYPDGMPCRSSALPDNVARVDEIKMRKSEILMEYYFEPCHINKVIYYTNLYIIETYCYYNHYTGVENVARGQVSATVW